MFHPEPHSVGYLIERKCRTVQHSSRHGKEPTTIVIHSTGSGRTPDLEAKTLTEKKEAGSWHTILDETTRINLIPYSLASHSNQPPNNLRTLNLGVCAADTDWPRLIRTGRHVQLIYHMAYEAVSMTRYNRAQYSLNIPARRTSKEEYHAGFPGFMSHHDLDGGACFDNEFPWTAFFNIYDRIVNPKKLSPETLIAEAAAVSQAPGMIASAALKNYDQYHTLGGVLKKSMSDDQLIQVIFFRYANRKPTPDELTKMRQIVESKGVDRLIEMVAVQMSLAGAAPTRNDLKLFEIQMGAVRVE